MKEGRSLDLISNELTRQVKERKDYLAPSDKLEMIVKDNDVAIKGVEGSTYGITEFAHWQFADRLFIPKKYYDRMRKTDPALLSHNVNTWMHKESKGRMLRILDGKIRGFLTSSYRPLDNQDLAKAVLPILEEKNCNVVSIELTDTKMYIKAVLPSLVTEIRRSKHKGDIVQAGIVISNSEVGNGSLKVESMIYRLLSSSGMVAPDSALRKYHIGKVEEVDEVKELSVDENKEEDNKAFWVKVRNIVREAFDQDVFVNLVTKIEEATQNEIKSSNLMEVVEMTVKKFVLPESSRKSILNHLIKDGDRSQWGLINAVTKTANEVSDYEIATDLERTGGKILELSRKNWKMISEAL